MKTLKVEAVYPMAFESFEDVAEYLPHFIEQVYNERRLHSALGYAFRNPAAIQNAATMPMAASRGGMIILSTSPPK